MFAPLDPKNPTTSELELMAGRVPLKPQPQHTGFPRCSICDSVLASSGLCFQCDHEAVMRTTSFQGRVATWMQETFGPQVSADYTERGFRFGEEAIELLQANGTTKEDVLKLVDYVYGRPVGELAQEVGGTMVTLAALCEARGIDLMAVANQEQQRCEHPAVRAKIQAKQADKRARMLASPLPGQLPECNDQQSKVNPDTHCLTCGEPLSEYGHCWQHDYPLTAADDPREAAAPYCNGQCGICSCISSPSTATATPTK